MAAGPTLPWACATVLCNGAGHTNAGHPETPLLQRQLPRGAPTCVRAKVPYAAQAPYQPSSSTRFLSRGQSSSGERRSIGLVGTDPYGTRRRFLRGEPRAPRPPSPPVSSSSSATLSLFSIGQGARRAAPLHTAHMRRTSLRKCTPAAATQPRLNWPVLSLPEAQHLTRAGFAFSWWYGRCAARVDAARALGPHAGCSTA